MNLVFLAAGLLQLAIAVHVLRHRWLAPLAATVLAVLCVAIAYDNLVVALGSTIGAGDLLRSLSVGRFALHALLTPTLLVAGSVLLARHGVRTKAFALPVAAGLAAFLVLVGVGLDFVGLDLVVEETGNVVRYASAEASAPIATIVTILAAVAMGVVLRRSGGPNWLLFGAAAMLVTGAAPSDGAPVIANLGEVALLLGAAMTLTALQDPTSPSTASVPTAPAPQPGG